MNVFEAVKSTVTIRQAAERYGITVRRNGMALCPFHDDKNPSMKVDHRFHCFACQVDGDVIDFVSRLYGLNSKEAAKKLAVDFGIQYDRDCRTFAKKSRLVTHFIEDQQRRREIQRVFRAYADYRQLLEHWKTAFAPRSPDEEWHPLFTEALSKLSYVEYLLDTMLYGTMEEQAEIAAEHGKEATAIERRISEFSKNNTEYGNEFGCDNAA